MGMRDKVVRHRCRPMARPSSSYHLGPDGRRHRAPPRDVFASVTNDDVSDLTSFGTCRIVDMGPVRTLASRISYRRAGLESRPMEEASGSGTALQAVGRHGTGRIGVYATGRLERATTPMATSWSSASTWSRRPWPDRRSRTPTSLAARYLEQRSRPRPPPLHVDRGRQHLIGWRQALHARQEPIQRPAGGRSWTPRAAARTSPARAQDRRSASTC
jgi:hypothetical protein